jgi:hypothetical protein
LKSHYLMIVKSHQAKLLARITALLLARITALPWASTPKSPVHKAASQTPERRDRRPSPLRGDDNSYAYRRAEQSY